MNIRPTKLLLVLAAFLAFRTVPLEAATNPPTPTNFFSSPTTLGTLSNGDSVYYLPYFNSYTYSGSASTTPTTLYKFNFGFLYFFNPASGDLSSTEAYFYDYTSGDFFYTSESLYPYFYSFNLGTFLYYFEGSNPRQFYNFKSSGFVKY